MRHTTQRGLDATKHYGYIGKQLLEDFGVNDGGVLGAHVVTAIRTVGILGTQTTGGGVLVDHRVHTAWGYAKTQAWTT